MGGHASGIPVGPEVLGALPDVAEVLEVAYLGESPWAKAFRITARYRDTAYGNQSYFMKVSRGQHGHEALKGEFAATSATYSITPDFCPKPIAWGSLRDEQYAHFHLCKFYDFSNGVPEPVSFCEKLARLHRHSSQPWPDAKFGFHCTTYNGDLPQDNNWSSSWEVFFANGLHHVLKVREERAGPDAELDRLFPDLFNKGNSARGIKGWAVES